MGDVYIDLTLMNDRDPQKQREVHFLADAGATRACMPENIASELDIQPIGRLPVIVHARLGVEREASGKAQGCDGNVGGAPWPLELANGEVREYPHGLCKFEYEGEVVNGTVVIGPEGIEPIAGTHVLQDFRLIVNVAHQTIRRARGMRAKVAT